MTSGSKAKLAVVGAGLIGRRHIQAIKRSPRALLAAVVDPLTPPDLDCPSFSSLEQLLASERPDGVILATPTLMHAKGALACIAAGLPVLVEKPLTATLAEAKAVTAAAAKAQVPVLVGHHRRHNPMIRAAVAAISSGLIGEVRSVQATCWFYKPNDYFDAAPWRKKHGAGPISVNLVHDVDLLRLFCGEVASVQAQMSPSRRGYENEDLASALLVFESGAIATLSVSDSIAAPWSWEMTSGENPAYPQTDQSCYLIGGSKGSLSLPDFRLWQHDQAQHWWHPIRGQRQDVPISGRSKDPLDLQIDQFVAVIQGREKPLVSAEDGLKTMAVIGAIARAAQSGQTVRIAAL